MTADKLADAVNPTELVKFVSTETKTVSVNASSGANVSFSISVPSGYIPVGVKRVATGTHAVIPYYFEVFMDGTANMNVRNVSTVSSINANCSMIVFCIKNI